MQARPNGIQIDDVPKQFWNHSSQSIILDKENSIPIYSHGPIPYIHTRYPTQEEMDSFPWFKLTNNVPWNPYESDLIVSSSESNEINNTCNMFHSTTKRHDAVVNSMIVDGFKQVQKTNQ